MSRLMSVALTVDAVVDRTKTQTRRIGWCFAKVGDRLTLCEKVMGRKAGDPLVKLAEVVITSVARVRLDSITPADVRREGFAHGDPDQFVTMFRLAHKCAPDVMVTRIEWRYVDA